MNFSRNTAFNLPVHLWFPHCTSILLLLAFQTKSLSQAEQDTISEVPGKEIRPAYIDISLGIAHASFRDFATSPLFYTGNPFYVSLAHIDIDEKRASSFRASYTRGKYDSDFNGNDLESTVNTISLNYLELFQLKKLSTQKLNLKIGGQFNSTGNIRRNEDLFNNREGVELISTLFGSVRGTLDVSREEAEEKKFLFIRYKAKKRVRKLSFTFNLGLINSSYRNGFAYTNSSAPLNEDEFFVDYEFRIFKGFRLNTALDYTIFLQNKNAIQFSYLWDAYRTAGHHDNFEMATHVLKCSLLFGLK